jgi:hypothetical protein
MAALITASAVAGALTVYAYRTLPLILAGKKSLGAVARDMLKMAEQIDSVQTGEVGAFRESATTLAHSVETARASLEVDSSTPYPSEETLSGQFSEATPPPADVVRGQLAEAANLLAMGFGLEAAAAQTRIPATILERLETSGNGEWAKIKEEAKAHMGRRMGSVFR